MSISKLSNSLMAILVIRVINRLTKAKHSGWHNITINHRHNRIGQRIRIIRKFKIQRAQLLVYITNRCLKSNCPLKENQICNSISNRAAFYLAVLILMGRNPLNKMSSKYLNLKHLTSSTFNQKSFKKCQAKQLLTWMV